MSTEIITTRIENSAYKQESPEGHKISCIGHDFEKKKDYENAIDCYQLATELGDSYTYTHLTNVYVELKKYDLAIESIKKLIQSETEEEFQKDSIIELGNIYFKAKKYNEALKTYKKALKICNTYETEENGEDICSYIGDTYCKIKNFDEAIKWYDKSIFLTKIIIDYGDYNPYHKIAKIYCAKKEYKNALKYLMKGCKYINCTPDRYSEYKMHIRLLDKITSKMNKTSATRSDGVYIRNKNNVYINLMHHSMMIRRKTLNLHLY